MPVVVQSFGFSDCMERGSICVAALVRSAVSLAVPNAKASGPRMAIN